MPSLWRASSRSTDGANAGNGIAAEARYQLLVKGARGQDIDQALAAVDAAESTLQTTQHEFQRANLDSVQRFPTTRYRDLSRRALGSVSQAVLDTARHR